MSAYVANELSNNVSVIDTATNVVVATVPVGSLPIGIAVTPDGKRAYVANQNSFDVSVIDTARAPPIATGSIPPPRRSRSRPAPSPTTIPPGSFIKQPDGSFAFVGVVNGVGLGAVIKPTGTLRYLVQAKAKGANLAGTKNAVYATLTIGGDSGATSVTAAISP